VPGNVLSHDALIEGNPETRWNRPAEVERVRESPFQRWSFALLLQKALFPPRTDDARAVQYLIFFIIARKLVGMSAAREGAAVSLTKVG
jgi:hypothetical protein